MSSHHPNKWYVQGRNAMAQLGSEMKEIRLKGPVCLVALVTPKRLLDAAWMASLKNLVDAN